jgi:hypothetical protein
LLGGWNTIFGCFFGKGGGNFLSAPGTGGNDFLSPGETGETNGCSAPSLDGACDSVKLLVPFCNTIHVSTRSSKVTSDTCHKSGWFDTSNEISIEVLLRTLGGRGGGAFLPPPSVEGLVGSVGLLLPCGTTGDVACRGNDSSCCRCGAGYEFPI